MLSSGKAWLIGTANLTARATQRQDGNKFDPSAILPILSRKPPSAYIEEEVEEKNGDHRHCRVADVVTTALRRVATTRYAYGRSGHYHFPMLIYRFHESADDSTIRFQAVFVRLHDGHPDREFIARANRLKPSDGAGAGRTYTGDLRDVVIHEKSHGEGSRVPAAGDKTAEGAPLGLFGIHMEDLRVVSSGKIEYILFPDYD